MPEQLLPDQFPYNQDWYDQRFVNREVLAKLHEICKTIPTIEKVYAKGSLVHGTMVRGSDIDHVRIKVKGQISLSDKKHLVDTIEDQLKEIGVLWMERIRDEGYVRVFQHWDELKSVENAHTTQYEVYPEVKVVTGKDLQDWYDRVMRVSHGYIGAMPHEWLKRMRIRILGQAHKYPVEREFMNIDNYSPFWQVNEVSPQYQQKPFDLPFIEVGGKVVPVHPDTFEDLELNPDQVLFTKEVFPTSSYRTVYDPTINMCYKLPLKRRITRGIRDLPTRHLKKAEFVRERIKLFESIDFHFLEEMSYVMDNPDFNYIMRFMPDVEVWPWFYVIKSQMFSKEFIMKAVTNLIHSWMFYAKNDWFLEGHTQNLLVDADAHIYYRDASDVSSLNRLEIKPQYMKNVVSKADAMSLVFDRTICNQNLDHLFRYDTVLGEEGKLEIRNLIAEEMERFGIIMPNYSLDFRHDEAGHVPIKTKLVWWRG